MVTTPEIAEVLCHSNYFNTFGGNPVCTSAGLAVLRVIEKENLQQNAHFVGSYLKERLMAIKNKHESKIFFSPHLYQIPFLEETLHFFHYHFQSIIASAITFMQLLVM